MIKYNYYDPFFNLCKNIIILILIILFVFWFNTNYGLSGLQGIRGLIGPNGQKGSNGLIGSPGQINYNNYSINKVTFGLIGPNGLIGSPGQKGPPGPIGFRGPFGLIGPNGTNGPLGQIGPNGPIGLPGPKGTDVNWHLSIIDRNDCLPNIYDEKQGNSECPVNTVMIGLENRDRYLQLKCCKLKPDIDMQNTKYELIKKGKPVNPINIYDY